MPSGEHEASIVADERFSVGVEIAEHGVATPASYDTNFIRIDASKEESHSSASTKRAGGYLFRMDASVPRYGEGSGAEEASYHGRGDGTTSAVVFVVDMKRSCGWGIMPFEVCNPSEGGTNWAGIGLAIGAVRELLTFYSILLRSEGESAESGSE